MRPPHKIFGFALSDNVVAAPLKKHRTTTHDRRHP